ncbi:MAG TPA: energy transducer TonB [Candidatus Angelobacter sp.]|nr:energy transducer TonB [Candidatus Angelobacter sp.]
MFGDTLLESSSASSRRKRWPMATAFTVEALIAAILVIVPLLSTGVIPVSARVPIYTPVQPVTLEPVRPVTATTDRASGQENSAPRQTVVLANNNPNAIHLASNVATTNDINEVTPPGPYVGPNRSSSDLPSTGPATTTTVRLGPKRIVSQLSEAQLLDRVEPVYPHIAIVTGVQGQVKLHAIIARDGSIQSLNVISGPPLLIHAATDAVSQWRYRPYVLNGEAVEVETFITVNFRKDTH